MSSNPKFNAGVVFDLGLGYDFGNIRVEELGTELHQAVLNLETMTWTKIQPLMATRRLSTTTSKIPLSGLLLSSDLWESLMLM